MCYKQQLFHVDKYIRPHYGKRNELCVNKSTKLVLFPGTSNHRKSVLNNNNKFVKYFISVMKEKMQHVTFYLLNYSLITILQRETEKIKV